MIKLEKLKEQITEIKDINMFFQECNLDMTLPVENWYFSTLPLEKSFDTFMQQLAVQDRKLAIQFAAIFARYAFADVLKNHIVQVREIGFAFLESDLCADGEPIEKQLVNIENWLKNPTEETMESVVKGIDPSRQVEIWEEDLFPPDDQMWLWIIENTQLLSIAVMAGNSEAQDNLPDANPYSWSYKACVSRSAVCSLKSIAKKNRELIEDVTMLFRKVSEEW